MVENQTRPRGMLTQADREFLRGEKDLSDQSTRNTRRRIRNRFYQALLDFSVLWTYLGEDDLELIFEAEDDQKRRAVRRAAQDAIALTILGLWQNDDYYPDRLIYAIQQAAYARNRSVSVELEIEEERMDAPDDILRRLLDSGFEHTTYEEFEKAVTDPASDPELLNELFERMDSDWDLSPDDLREFQKLRKESEVIRRSLPYVINVEPVFDPAKTEKTEKQSRK